MARQPVYISVCAVCAPRVDTFQNGREIRMALLMYCGISVYDMITSRTMRVIWDVCSVLLSCPYRSCYLWESINNLTKSVTGKQGRMIFPSLSLQFPLSSLLQQLLRILKSFCMLKKVCSCSEVHQVSSELSTSCLESGEISRKIIQRSGPRVDEWHGMWEKKWARFNVLFSTNGLEVHP